MTGYLQTALYAIFIRAGDPKPAPGSARFIRDRRRIHIAVIVAYLLYTVYEADWQLLRESDFYQLLGVPHDVEEKALQSRFRRLTVQYHPDKATGPDKQAIEAIYVQLKLARDNLVDPVKRFAYDRFGPGMLEWKHCKTIRDFVMTGVQQQTGYYVGSASVLLLLGVLGYLEQGKFWRYLVMGSLYAIEMYTMTRPTFPAILTRFVNPLLLLTRLRPPYLPFQTLALLRKLTVTFFIAMSQLGPLLKDPQQEVAKASGGISPQQLSRLDALANATDQEVTRLLALELAPFASASRDMKGLRSSLRDWLIQNTIRNDPEVRSATEIVLARRRTGASGIEQPPS